MIDIWCWFFGQVGNFNVWIEESIGGIWVVKVFVNEFYEKKLFVKDNEDYCMMKLKVYCIMIISMIMSYFSICLVQLIVMVVGIWYVVYDQLSYGGFVGFLLLVEVFFCLVVKIILVLESYLKGIVGFK